MTLTYPVPGFPITTAFQGYPGHNGCDMAAPGWTPILAAHDGVVTYSGWQQNTADPDSGGGWMVNLRAHDYESGTSYQHMIQAPEVGYGQTVTAGQVIGYVGSTGRSTGNHLHFETHVGGPVWAEYAYPVDPAPYLQGDDMTPEQARKLDAIYAALFGPANIGIDKMTWANPDGTREAFYGVLDIDIYTQSLVAQVLGQNAAILEAVKQIGGGDIDLAAVEAAAEKGARDALATLTLKAVA